MIDISARARQNEIIDLNVNYIYIQVKIRQFKVFLIVRVTFLADDASRLLRNLE